MSHRYTSILLSHILNLNHNINFRFVLKRGLTTAAECRDTNSMSFNFTKNTFSLLGNFTNSETKSLLHKLSYRKFNEFQNKIITWVKDAYSDQRNDESISLIIGDHKSGKTSSYLLALTDLINMERYELSARGCKRDDYRIKLISYSNSRGRDIGPIKSLPKIHGIPKFDWNNLLVPLGIVIVPSREVGLNVFDLASKHKLRSKLIAGGKGYKKQTGYINGCIRVLNKDERDNIDLFICTPEMLIKALSGEYEKVMIDVKFIKFLFMEESDLLCDGFYLEQLTEIFNILDSVNLVKVYISSVHEDKLKNYLVNLYGKFHEIKSSHNKMIQDGIQQIFDCISQGDHLERLLETLNDQEKTVIFCNTVKCCKFLSHSLKDRGYNISSLHGEMNYEERTNNIQQFRNSSDILVTTNIATRFKPSNDIKHVISFDFPKNVSEYSHRAWTINKNGTITTFFSRRNLRIIKDIHKISSVDNLIEYKNVNSRIIKALQVQRQTQILPLKKKRKHEELKLSHRSLKSPGRKKVLKKFYLRQKAINKVELLRKRGILKKGQGLPKMPDRQVEVYDSQEYIKMHRSPDGFLQYLPKRRSRIIKENKYGHDRESIMINEKMLQL